MTVETLESIVALAYVRIMEKNKGKFLSFQQVQELGEIAFFEDPELAASFCITGHRAAGQAIRKHHEQLSMVHPFANEQDLRYSQRNIVEMVQNVDRICFCGEKHNIHKLPDQWSHPKFIERQSTADIFTCNSCGRKWEEAYTIVYSMCVLKSGNQDEDLPK